MKPYILLGVCVFVLALAGKYFLLSPSSAPNDSHATLLSLQELCDLRQGACSARNDAGVSIRFSITPNSIPLMQELVASVETAGLGQPVSANLTVEGVNMFMGFQSADLQAGNSTTVLQGKFTLPVCSMQTMQWKASVLVVAADGQQYRADFPFTTSR
ncbi:hypothetical protein VSS37_20890 [Candidatus Thiothrix sp. Deng01]|uniref:Uncharacterized protein n=1 Tax=Candidatus Thiothrix phosphatis TaxID=3112415 RepID=A0ABU6D3P2_9GAMM|nr:hypothetical protein [Candidatus Thiothrix sp. Deng01]MEB4593447.1 hypothetical protein [Candidatus Thiothrix sp. Deng01]